MNKDFAGMYLYKLSSEYVIEDYSANLVFGPGEVLIARPNPMRVLFGFFDGTGNGIPLYIKLPSGAHYPLPTPDGLSVQLDLRNDFLLPSMEIFSNMVVSPSIYSAFGIVRRQIGE